MGLSASEIAKITTYLDATTPLPPGADLLFIPGTRLHTPADMAADLFRRGMAGYIVVTGGENRVTGENEAALHLARLIESGIPAQQVIVEGQSTSSLENVTFALPLIAEKVPLTSLTAIIAICKWMHSRRILMTLKRHFPPGIRYYAHTYEPEGITRENWPLSPRQQSANVLKNWERIPQYLAWGHIEEITRVGDHYI
jgi:hypothetical protein